MKIVYRYVWKELTQDGLLKNPEDVGSYYKLENVNGWNGGYLSEQEAEEAFIEFKKSHEYCCPYDLVLVKLGTVMDVD